MRRSIFIMVRVSPTAIRILRLLIPGLTCRDMCGGICLWVRRSGRIFRFPSKLRMLGIGACCWITALLLEGFTITIGGRFMVRCGTGFTFRGGGGEMAFDPAGVCLGDLLCAFLSN